MSTTVCGHRLKSVISMSPFCIYVLLRRGWGLRCLDDIPRGTFICTYSGQILNEEMADKVGFLIISKIALCA